MLRENRASMRIPPCLAALAFAVALPASAQSAEGGGALYRCPGNDYNNTLSPSEAEKLHCKKVENASVTVIQSAKPAAAVPSAASASAVIIESAAPPPRAALPLGAEPMSQADAAALRVRATNARKNLEGRLKSEETRLSTLEKEFNGGEPERRIDEFDFQKYLDRVATMRSAIARKQIDIAELRREIDKLPTR
jgi:hypothetical protein